MKSPFAAIDERYADRGPLDRVRAKGMVGVYGAVGLALIPLVLSEVFSDVAQNQGITIPVYLASMLVVVAGIGLVWARRDELATHAVSVIFVVFTAATLAVAMKGRPDQFFSGWSKWYPVFIATTGLFLATRACAFIAGASALWSAVYYLAFGHLVEGTEHAIVPSDVVDTVAVCGLVGGITLFLITAVERAIDHSEEALARERGMVEGLEKLVAVRTVEVEQALADRQTVIDHMAHGLVAVGPDGVLSLVNAQVGALLGRSELDQEATAISELMNGELMPLIHSVRESGEPDELVVQPEKGRFVKIVATPLPSAEGTGVVAIVRDVTLEREVDRLKTEFISTVSHELRTPLTSVLGFSRVVRDRLKSRIAPAVPSDDVRATKAVDQALTNLDIVLAEGKRLTELINDVLDIAKMEAGRVEWRRDRLDVGDLVEQGAAAVSGLFPPDRPVVLEVDVAPDLGQIVGDGPRLVQVLVNLLSNASKFTREGTVRLMGGIVDGAIELAVEDTGAGIPPQRLAYVFERFRQVEDTMTDKPSGTGLGLPICRQIARAHGTEIQVESEPGRGSRFWFRLQPADRNGADDRADHPGQDPSGATGTAG